MWAVLRHMVISVEPLLARVSIPGSEYIEDQLAGGSSHERRSAPRASHETEFDHAMASARHFEDSSRLHAPPAPMPAWEDGKGGRTFMPAMCCVSAISPCARLRTVLRATCGRKQS